MANHLERRAFTPLGSMLRMRLPGSGQPVQPQEPRSSLRIAQGRRMAPFPAVLQPRSQSHRNGSPESQGAPQKNGGVYSWISRRTGFGTDC
mgnify:CR=1 FL=1